MEIVISTFESVMGSHKKMLLKSLAQHLTWLSIQLVEVPGRLGSL